MASNYWAEKAIKRAQDQIARSKSKMKETLAPAVLRRPNTSQFVTEALRNPEALEPTGRDKLAQWVMETYGPGAQHILPYLGVEAEERTPF